MEVRLLGIVTEVRLEQPKKAFSPMEVTLLGMIVFLHPAINILLSFSIIALQFSRESYFVFPDATLIEDKLLHEPKALLPMEVTLFGIAMLVRPEQPSKASKPMVITLLGIVMLVKPEQLQKAP